MTSVEVVMLGKLALKKFEVDHFFQLFQFFDSKADAETYLATYQTSWMQFFRKKNSFIDRVIHLASTQNYIRVRISE